MLVAEKRSSIFSVLLRHVKAELSLSLRRRSVSSAAWCSLAIDSADGKAQQLEEARKLLEDIYEELASSGSNFSSSVLDRDYLEGLFAGAAAFPRSRLPAVVAKKGEVLVRFLDKWAYLGSPGFLAEVSFLLRRIPGADLLAEEVEGKVREQIDKIAPDVKQGNVSLANLPPSTVRKIVELLFGLRGQLQFSEDNVQLAKNACPIEDLAKLALWATENRMMHVAATLFSSLNAHVSSTLLETSIGEVVEGLREYLSLRSTDPGLVPEKDFEEILSQGHTGLKLLPSGELVVEESALKDLPTLAPKADALILLSLSKGGREMVVEFASSDMQRISTALQQTSPGFFGMSSRWFDILSTLLLSSELLVSALGLLFIGLGMWLAQLWGATVSLLDLQVGTFLDQSLRTLPHPVLLALVLSYFGFFYTTNMLSLLREKGDLQRKDLIFCLGNIPVLRRLLRGVRRLVRPTSTRVDT